MAILIAAGETTAAQKYVYFHCVDATDGLAAETGEAGNQPQISTNGASFTNTGIGVLVAIGNGRYYAELTDAAVNTTGRVIESRYKSAATAEAVGTTVQVTAALSTSDKVKLDNTQTGVTIPTVTAAGSVSGAVGSVTGAVGSVGAGGIDAASFAADAIAAAAIATGAVTADAFAADAIVAATLATGAVSADAFAANAIVAATLAADLDTYQAKVVWFDDESNVTDRYVVTWFKNSQPITSGITVPKLQIVKVADGSDLIAASGMTEIASLGRYRYDATTTERQTSGAAYLAIATATIGGSSRNWDQSVSRDSTA